MCVRLFVCCECDSFKYEQGGRLSDLSLPPSLLQSVHQLLEVSVTVVYGKSIC